MHLLELQSFVFFLVAGENFPISCFDFLHPQRLIRGTFFKRSFGPTRQRATPCKAPLRDTYSKKKFIPFLIQKGAIENFGLEKNNCSIRGDRAELFSEKFNHKVN